MDSAGYECAFFSEKLGMLFNTHDSKLTVVGLDSHLYGQTALSNLSSVPIKSQIEKDTATKDAYHDAITLNPSLTDGESAAGHVNHSEPILIAPAESKQEAVEKFLDAFANFDDGSSPIDRENLISNLVDCDCFSEGTDEPATMSVQIPTQDAEPKINFDMPYSPKEEGVVASESFNDFQNTLASMSGSTKFMISTDVALNASSDPNIGDLSLEIPAQDLALAGEGSPFEFHHTQTSTTCEGRKDRQSNEAKPDWLPPAPSAPIASPATPPPPSPSAPPSTTPLSLSIETARTQVQDTNDAIADNYGLASPGSSRSQFVTSRERARLLQLFGFHASWVNKTHLPELAKAINTGSCDERKWVLSKASAEQFIGCSVEYVNGVKVSDLDPAFQQALMKQRSRPLLMQFQPTLLLEPPSERANTDVTPSIPGVKVAAQVTEKFPYTLFMAKYTSTAASKIRSTVDSTLQDYVQCNWADVKAQGEGLPQVTIVSIYKYIECEMHKLDLFTHSHARGYGVPPEMKEEHWDDIRGHIETMVYRAIGAHTRTLWPIFCQDDNNQLDRSEREEFVDADTAASDLKTNTFIGVDLSISSTTHASTNVNAAEGEPEVTSIPSTPRLASPVVELSTEHPLRMKLAFLRFVTLESTGLDCGHDKPKQTEDDGELDHSFTFDQRGNSQADNQIARTAPELETPLATPVSATLQEQLSSPATRVMVQKIRRINRIMLRHKEEWYLAMRGLCRAMQLETPGNVLHALVNTVKLISHALDAYINRPDEHNPAVDEVLQDTCAKFNAYRARHISCACGNVHLVTESDNEVSLSLTSTNEILSGEIITGLFAGTRCLTLARDPLLHETDQNGENNDAEGAKSGLSKTKKKKKEHRPLSADDLMPAITWVLIQANPPNIEYIVWMCTEFRHPNLLRGEEAFCLAQLSSAVEFCKHATHRAFDIPHGDYNALMVSYNNTLKLLLACKVGNLGQVQELVEHGNANVNGLSPDHKDSPLTACIKFGQHAILRYLLARPEIDVDAPVQLFHGPDQRSTPLILAVQYNQFEMIIDLLVAGADRHYCNDAGDSALSTAIDNELALESLVLKADPAQYELVSQIIEGKKLVVIGLLLQRIPVNYLLQPENSLSPLIAAVLKRDTDVIRFLLHKRLCHTDVNLVNAQGATALIACAKEFAQTPSQELLNIAAMLLRFGANRHLRDKAGLSVFEYIRSARDAIKTLERTVQNPFGVHSDGTSKPSPSSEPLPETPPVPSVPAKDAPVTSAASVISPVPQKRHSAIVSPSTQSPFGDVNDSRIADSSGANNINNKAVPAVRSESGAETPPPLSSAPVDSPVKVNPVHKQLLKEFSLLLANDPLSENAVPIFELARDKKINDVRSLLYQGVNVNAVCVSKGYSALIAAVYNSDLPMLQLILQADAICKQTYFTTQYSILSAVKSLLRGTPDTLEADADLLVNDDGITEGEKGGYLRTVDPAEPLFVSDDGEIKLVSKRNTVDLDRAGRYGMRALHYASQIGNISIVGALLQAGAAREVYNDKLHTPLDVCVANDHIDAANAIRFDPERVSICLAAKHGDWVVMSALLCQGVSINTQRNHMSKTGDQVQHELYTPLLAAAAHGQVEVIKKILDVPEVNVNLANSLNQTALMFAAARGDEAVVLLLLHEGADRWVLDKQGYIASAWAESRNRESVATILKHDPSRIWIHDVIRNNDFPAVIAMLKQKVDPNLRRTTKLVPHSPAMVSASTKATHANADTVGNHKTKAAPAGKSKSPPMKLNPSIDQHHDTSAAGSGFIHGETPLIVAARYGRLDVIAILLKAPPPQAVDMTLTDSAGNSALHHSALKGHEDTVLLLLKSHAARHMRNHMGLNASTIAKSAGFINIAAIIDADPHTVHIHDMCEQGDMRMVVALLKQGCPVNYKDPRASKRQQTPLMAAAIGGQADIVRMLLRDSDAQAHIDGQDSVGRTALMRAASVGALSVTAVLLNAGCDRTLKDHQGLTARDHASKHSYTVMFQFISQSMVR